MTRANYNLNYYDDLLYSLFILIRFSMLNWDVNSSSFLSLSLKKKLYSMHFLYSKHTHYVVAFFPLELEVTFKLLLMNLCLLPAIQEVTKLIDANNKKNPEKEIISKLSRKRKGRKIRSCTICHQDEFRDMCVHVCVCRFLDRCCCGCFRISSSFFFIKY